MKLLEQYLVFRIEDKKLALAIGVVSFVMQAAEILESIGKADRILGFINIKGEIIPVANIRRLLKIEERPLDLNDKFILIDLPKGKVVFVAEEIYEVLYCKEEEKIEARDGFYEIEGVKGMICFEEERVLILDAEKLLEFTHILSRGCSY